MSKTISGALIGRALGAFGDKPVIPELDIIDPTLIQGDTIAGNLKNLAGAEKLGARVNRFNAEQARAALDIALPGQFGKASSIVSDQLSGRLPGDVSSFVQRQATSQAFGLGVGGSGVHANITTRDLGLTSLQVQQQGLQNFGALAGMLPPQFDVSSMFLSPTQRLAFAAQDRSAHFERDLLASQVAAAPNPADVALAEGFDNFGAFWAGVGGAFLGNPGGGGALSTTGGGPGGAGAGATTYLPRGGGSGFNTSSKASGGGFMGGIV